MIYIKDGNTHNTIKKFISAFIYAESFYDPELQRRQCRYGAKRSYSDIYEAVKTYFPEATHKEVALELVQNYRCWYCTAVNKVVFWKGQVGYTSYTDRGKKQTVKGIDGFSYRDIVLLSNNGIVNHQDDNGHLICYDKNTNEKVLSFGSKRQMSLHFDVSPTTIYNAFNKGNTSLNQKYIFKDENA